MNVVLRAVSGLLGAGAGFFLGLFAGAVIAGNFADGLAFAGLRGYEAGGVIGAWTGAAVLGALSAAFPPRAARE
jgi:hypothetical protein